MATTTKKAPAKAKTRASKTLASKTHASKAPAKKRAANNASTAPKARVAVKANGSVARKTATAKPATAKPATAKPATAKPKTPVATPVAPARMTVPVVVNAKLADIARTNMNAGLDLVCGLASAKTPMEAMRLGLAYWVDNVSTFRAQAQDLRKLSAELVSMANEPIRESIRRS